MMERITRRKLDEKVLRRVVELSSETGELWSQIKMLTRERPSPFDAYFDSVTMMGPLYCLRGTEECRDFFAIAYEELKRKADAHVGPLAQERFRVGANTFVDVVQARADFQRAESDRINAIYEFHRAYATLESAVGRPLR